MKNNFFILISCLLIISVATSQQVNIQGKITNNFDVEGIHILNQTSKYNTVTNQNGEFVIRIQINDTLLISSIKFEILQIVISEKNIKSKHLDIKLTELINELDEVMVGNTLTGNLAYDIKNIKTEKDIDFDDVGIPGFKGIPQERIVPAVEAFFPTNINIEAAYKHITGYYKKLKIKRKWTSENTMVVEIIDYYGFEFFNDAYQLPQNRLYDFMLFCMETSSLQSDFRRNNFAGVLQIFEDKSKVYISRLAIPKEQIKE